MSGKTPKSVKQRGSRFSPSQLGSSGIFNPSALANPDKDGLQIQIYHIPTKQTVEFAAFITDFADNFTSTWDSQDVLGRMDPVMNFQSTARNISLGWDVPSSDWKDASRNMAEVNKLIQFLYPRYEKHGEARAMAGSPLVKIQFQNLIASGKGAANIGAPLSVDAKANGLIAAITNLTATPDFESGFFSDYNRIPPDKGEFAKPGKPKEETSGNGQWPKLWRISIGFTVLHDHLMGDSFEDARAFPYYTPGQEEYAPGAEGTAVVDDAPSPSAAAQEAQMSLPEQTMTAVPASEIESTESLVNASKSEEVLGSGWD